MTSKADFTDEEFLGFRAERVSQGEKDMLARLGEVLAEPGG